MPLATLLRPENLADFIGQERLLGEKGPLRKLIESGQIPSMIFWGPPSSGKTTLASIISKSVEADFITLSAVNSGKADLRKVIARSADNKNHDKKTILFIDEIHRWNKAQQDALLPYVENGDIILIGATTENPSFTVINALLSRTRVFVFDEHKPEDVRKALIRGVETLKHQNIETTKQVPSNVIPVSEVTKLQGRPGSGSTHQDKTQKGSKDQILNQVQDDKQSKHEIASSASPTARPSRNNLDDVIPSLAGNPENNKSNSGTNLDSRLRGNDKNIDECIDDDAINLLSEISNGDMRFALNSLELAFNLASGKKITREIAESAVQKSIRYDRNGEEHYNIISAVHKSLRSSNATAAVYWIARMLSGGEDPLYIARRLIRFASEDIGNANPNALLLANVVYDTCHKIGMPECEVALVQLAKYLADSKKDNSAYVASAKAKEDIQKYGELPVPLHFRNAPTKLMKELDYGKGYEYDHDLDSKKSDQQTMPDELVGREYF